MSEVSRVLETEVRQPIAVIEMDMARHSVKRKDVEEGDAIGQPGMESAAQSRDDLEAKVQAITESGKPVSIVGSPRQRTTQSSIYRALGEKLKEVSIEGMEPDDMVRWLESGGVIEKTNTELLNFQDGTGEYEKDMTKAYEEGRLMRWMIEKSDELAVNTEQVVDKATPLSVQAGNVSMLIYSLGRLRTDRVLSDEQLENDLNVITSHQSVLESFLYKVITLKDGEDVGEQFVADLSEAGFRENQGFNCKYEQFEDGDWQVRINFEGKEYVVTKEEMVQIAQEGADLKAKMKPAE